MGVEPRARPPAVGIPPLGLEFVFEGGGGGAGGGGAVELVKELCRCCAADGGGAAPAANNRIFLSVIMSISPLLGP